MMSFSLRDDDASLSVSGVARSVFSVFVSPSDDDDEKTTTNLWKLETRIACDDDDWCYLLLFFQFLSLVVKLFCLRLALDCSPSSSFSTNARI